MRFKKVIYMTKKANPMGTIFLPVEMLSYGDCNQVLIDQLIQLLIEKQPNTLEFVWLNKTVDPSVEYFAQLIRFTLKTQAPILTFNLLQINLPDCSTKIQNAIDLIKFQNEPLDSLSISIKSAEIVPIENPPQLVASLSPLASSQRIQRPIPVKAYPKAFRLFESNTFPIQRLSPCRSISPLSSHAWSPPNDENKPTL